MSETRIAFIYVADGADPKKHRIKLPTPEGLRFVVIGVENYKVAKLICKDLVEKEGVQLIELCGGFGHLGVAEIKKVVGNEVAVGVVRFDYHPDLNFKSGDDFFSR